MRLIDIFLQVFDLFQTGGKADQRFLEIECRRICRLQGRRWQSPDGKAIRIMCPALSRLIRMASHRRPYVNADPSGFFADLQYALPAAGLHMADVFKIKCLPANVSDLARVREEFFRYGIFGDTTVSAPLALPPILIEVESTAHRA